MRSYPKYRKTNIEWLGEIPDHWEITKIKRIAKVGYKTFTDGDWIESPYITDEGVRLIQTGNIGIGFYKEQGYRYISQETFHTLRCTEVFPGDILVCRLADPVGRACLAPDLGCPMITSVDVCIIKPSKEYDSKFIIYFLSSSAYLDWLKAICRGGTRDRVSRDMLGAIHFLKPPLDEQIAISHYLDKETSRIDALIAKKQRLIELLQEKRTALISQAVTKGLDPNVPMKDSGVEWLGKIPEHWKVLPVWMLFYLGRGRVISNEEIADHQGTYPVYSSQTEDNGILGYIDTFDFDGDYLTWTTDGANAGTVFLRQGKFNCTNVCGTLFPKQPEIDLRFFKYAIGNATLWFVRKDINPKLMNNMMAKIRVQVPPYIEQRTIADHIELHDNKISKLISQILKGIEILEEYRNALINAVVTGKIDVRGIV